MKIWGTEIQIVSIVARIRSIRMQSTKITYTIQDITGRMRAVLWLDQEAMEVEVSESYFQFQSNVNVNEIINLNELIH